MSRTKAKRPKVSEANAVVILHPEGIVRLKVAVPEPIVKPECKHMRTEVRTQVRSNGVQVYVRQCLQCGQATNVAKKTLPQSILASARPVNEALKEAWHKKLDDYWHYETERKQAEWRAQQSEQSQQWWASYNAYLESSAWRKKRALVIDRAEGVCEGCGTKPPTHVHHLTYEHVGEEMLFELVAVCNPCHEFLHKPKEAS